MSGHRRDGGGCGSGRGDFQPPLQEWGVIAESPTRVEPFREERPDAFCSRCCRWGHIGPGCRAPPAAPRCSLCEGEHLTIDYRCPVAGYGAGRGHVKCRNYKGPHPSRSREFPERKQARQSAAGWRSPPPPRREQRAKPPPLEEVTAPPLGWRRRRGERWRSRWRLGTVREGRRSRGG